MLVLPQSNNISPIQEQDPLKKGLKRYLAVVQDESEYWKLTVKISLPGPVPSPSSQRKIKNLILE
jgi:hypothetical protein